MDTFTKISVFAAIGISGVYVLYLTCTPTFLTIGDIERNNATSVRISEINMISLRETEVTISLKNSSWYKYTYSDEKKALEKYTIALRYL
jgi:hypothetical protein